jgi:hypothetical protein
MPFATSAWDSRTARRLAAAGAAVALQAIFYWLTLQQAVQPTRPPRSTPIEVTLFEGVRPKPGKLPRTGRRIRSRQEAPKREKERARAPIVKRIARAHAAKPAAHAGFDWRSAMRGAVRAEVSGSGAKGLRFGFPRPPEPAPMPPRFGWDYARTHRVEELPQGGILINLTDHCSLVLYGLVLLPGCRLGRIAADGHLFDGMRERRGDRPGALP